MNKRQKKKLKNRAGFFHYKNYKLRVRTLYDLMKPIMDCPMPYSFKLMMFEYTKNMLFVRPPKKIYNRNLKCYDYKPFITNCADVSVDKYADIMKQDVIPSMSVRMVGDKIHSFSIDEDSFKNGYKPEELAAPLPKGPLDGFKSMASDKLTPDTMTIEHSDTDRMCRRIAADEYIKGGSAIEYPGSATIDLRKMASRYGNMSIKGVETEPTGPLHIDIDGKLDTLTDYHKHVAGNSCEASALD